jgi:ligand-binding sensor domain-containing protein/DNA-binding CsgD family transcriptional regulator
MQAFRLFFVILYTTLLFACPLMGQQRLAQPRIVNFNNDGYKGGMQNWAIAQDARGLMYFGNNEGLLVYDGRYWKKFPLPNATVVRSVAVDADGRIYVGGQDEVGYFEANAHGILTYHSLLDKVPVQDMHFADIWKIILKGKEVFFRASTRILHLKDDIITVYPASQEWLFLGEANDEVYIQALNQGILKYEEGLWKPVANHPGLIDMAITSIMPYNGDTILISTLKNGLFLMSDQNLIKKSTPIDHLFEQNRIFCAYPINEEWIAFGTTSGGLLITDRAGNLVQQYDFREGLQTNNIRHVFVDRNRNLWLGLDNGIDFIAVNSAIKYILPNKTTSISSYAIRFSDNKLFIGTSNGLYATPLQSNSKDLSLSSIAFSQVPQTEGQVWNLDEINGNLMIGHEDGGLLYEEGQIKKIYSVPGTWVYKPTSSVFPSSDVIAGTYLGLQHLSFQNGQFINRGRIEGPYESLRFVEIDKNNGTVWASHPYRGVYRMSLSPDYAKILDQKVYTNLDGLPSTLHNYVFRIKNQLVVAAKDGIYTFNEEQNKFMPSPLYKALKNIEIQYMKEDKYGNVWFITHKKLGILDFEASSEHAPFTIHYFPELDGKVLAGFENIYPLDDENIFIGANMGAIHVNYRRYKEQIVQPDIVLSYMGITDNQKQYFELFGGGSSGINTHPKVKYSTNSFHFGFSSTHFNQQSSVEFSYLLEGYDRNWSQWSDRSEKEYTNLRPGKYTFKVKSRNSHNNESAIVSYAFTVRPPWYGHPIMLLVYLVCIGLVIAYLFKRQKKKLQIHHEKELYLHQLELDRSEKEVVRLQNEKLANEISFKNKELANMTMHLVQRGEVLSKIKEALMQIAKTHEISDKSINVRQLVRLLRDAERKDEDWELFSIHFNHVNEGFFTRLKAQHPDLTPNELKLCALLSMNLTSKEVAQLMNITIKAVEVGRYRLRKKLKLEVETHLYSYLLQFTSEKQHIK